MPRKRVKTESSFSPSSLPSGLKQEAAPDSTGAVKEGNANDNADDNHDNADKDDPWPLEYKDLSQDPEVKEGLAIAEKIPYPPDMERSARVRKGVLQRQRDEGRNPKYKKPGRKLPLEERQASCKKYAN